MGADQPLTAARCVGLDVARVLDPLSATAEQISRAAQALLANPAPAAAAARFAAEMANFPDAAQAVQRIEVLA
jgi:UDP:flavonoid glycosyltransferase YjiC (YdhE family)